VTRISKIALMLPALVLCLGAEDSVALRAGTPVLLAFAEHVSSKTATKGERVEFVLASDIDVNGSTVVKAGAKAYGEVMEVRRTAVPGRSGAISLRLDYLQAGDTRIKLRSSEQSGENTVQYSRPAHFKWPMGLLRTGDDVEIGPGTVLAEYVAEDVSLPAAR
jgi:hypothetical protein